MFGNMARRSTEAAEAAAGEVSLLHATMERGELAMAASEALKAAKKRPKLSRKVTRNSQLDELLKAEDESN